MNDSTPDRDVTELAQLISEVHQLNGNAATTAREVKALRESNKRLVSSRRRHRLALILGGIGLCVDLVLTIIVIHLIRGQNDFNSRQACVNQRSRQFFTAEQAKVAGQVAGLRKLQHAGGDRAEAVAGFNQFIDSSQHYLDVIASVKGKCQ